MYPGGGGGLGEVEFGTGFCANAPEPARRNASSAKTIASWKPLMAGREISAPSVNRERRKAARRAKLELDLAPFTILGVIGRPVSDDILIAQLHAYFCRY